MKVYRIVPDILYEFDSRDYRGPEGVYNLDGKFFYQCHEEKIDHQGCNSLSPYLEEESKFFYLFPEDAIKYGERVLRCWYARLVEYDIPEELVVANAGFGLYGYYGDKEGPYAVETAIPCSKLGSNDKYLYSPKKEELEDLILKSYDESFNLHKYFWNPNYKKNTEGIVKSAYDRIAKCRDCRIADTTFLTGNIWGFYIPDQKKSIKYLGEHGLILDSSFEGEEKRNFITRDVRELLRSKAFKEVNEVIRERIPEYIKIYQKTKEN